MDDYLGLIELALVFLCLIAGWAVMEWQGRRLDRARAARDKKE
jgi:cbb3-type cytochrome oxidase subunit 3